MPPSRPTTIWPAGLTSVGTLHPDTLPILLSETVLDEILEYSAADLTRERGGFLIGSVVDEPIRGIEIRHFLPAVQTRSAAASLTFTHDTLAARDREVEQRFPGDLVVGWQHTHPGIGVFLSEYDLFVHRNYFSAAWHVAMVVDPKRQEFEFFQWQGDRVVDCGFLLRRET